MYDESKFKELGFTDFTHLDKSKRDDYKRLIKFFNYKNKFVVVILIMKDRLWELESIKIDDEIIKKDHPKYNFYSIENIIEQFFLNPPNSPGM